MCMIRFADKLRQDFLLSTLVSGRSVVRLSRLLWEQEVAGSNPAAPTKIEIAFEISFIKVLIIERP